ncbi:hypothetical protein F383_31887 [Gossypium arboreum]|uniref:Uncharacterized protein n=1 Tax=Gossypium arboreum TaxID=29729 RepID=A0A0B0PG57_GOSAR|nr:hypothetical protein F383_31887 [Gossypium arboreum]
MCMLSVVSDYIPMSSTGNRLSENT